jgi:hypothetical protein
LANIKRRAGDRNIGLKPKYYRGLATAIRIILLKERLVERKRCFGEMRK